MITIHIKSIGRSMSRFLSLVVAAGYIEIEGIIAIWNKQEVLSPFSCSVLCANTNTARLGTKSVMNWA